jgi:hypothetical protein
MACEAHIRISHSSQQTRERISGYVLNDALRLTQPIRAAHPVDEIRNLLPTMIMQNKANFRKSQMNLSFYSKKGYENGPTSRGPKNKANQSQFLYQKTCSLFIMPRNLCREPHVVHVYKEFLRYEYKRCGFSEVY